MLKIPGAPALSDFRIEKLNLLIQPAHSGIIRTDSEYEQGIPRADDLRHQKLRQR